MDHHGVKAVLAAEASRVNAPIDVNRLWIQARIESVLIALRERLALRRGRRRLASEVFVVDRQSHGQLT